MKKLILSLCLISCLCTPIFARASTQEELTQQLIVLLTETIAKLQQQISDILISQAKQINTINQQTATIQAQGATLQQIAQNTTPITIGAITEARTYPDLQISCSGKFVDVAHGYTIRKNGGAEFTASASGGTGEYQYGWNCGYSQTSDGVITIKQGDNFTKTCFKETNIFSVPIVGYIISPFGDLNICPEATNTEDACYPERLDKNGTGSIAPAIPIGLFVKSGDQIKKIQCLVNLN